MPVTTTVSNHFKYQLGKKLIDMSSDDFMIILMNSAFAFNEDTHALLSDIASSQLSTLNGYVQNGKDLSSQTWTEDDTNDKGAFACDDVTWAATSVDDANGIGPTGSCCIIDKSAVQPDEFFTTATDQTFTGGSTNWANGDIGTTFDDTTDLSLVASATGQYCGISFTNIGTALTAGGLYRLQYDYAESVAGFEFKINGVALQTLGDAVAGTSQYIDFFADESFSGANELRIYSKTGSAAAGDFDNFSLKELGTVVCCVDFDTDYTIYEGAGSSLQIQNIVISTT